jgi:hypothetical protein
MSARVVPGTPLPWRVSPAKASEVQQASGVWSIGTMGTDGAANAAYIAHCANAYPRLVEALKEAKADLAESDALQAAYFNADALLRELGEL